MKKKNIKSKKYGNTENKVEEHNTWCIGKVMGTSIINGLQNYGYLMQKR